MDRYVVELHFSNENALFLKANVRKLSAGKADTCYSEGKWSAIGPASTAKQRIAVFRVNSPAMPGLMAVRFQSIL
jgi:hypothetical protein